MTNFDKYRQNINLIQRKYIIAFVTYLMLSRSVLFVNIISQGFNSILYAIFAIAGAFLVVGTVVIQNKDIINKWTLLLLIFCAVCGISCVLNFRYGIVNNVKTMVWLSIQFFVLFIVGYATKEEWAKKFLCQIGKISSAIWFVGVMISLVQFLFQVKYTAPFSEFRRRQGFVDSRLFGIFSDPNYAAVTSLVIIVFCYFLYKGAKRPIIKKYYLTNIIVQILYIILSGSRTALIEGVLLAFFLAYFEERNKRYLQGESRVKRKALCRGVIGALLSVALIVTIPFPMKGIAKVGVSLRRLVLQDSEMDKEIDLDREDVSLENVSNNRTDIWASALNVSKESRIFGLSPRNMISYARENYPDSFIAETGYETHNGYLAVFVGVGVIGFGVMVTFAIFLVQAIIKYVKRMQKNKYDDEVLLTFAIIALIAISTMMLQDIFFVNTYSAAIFWLFLGCLLNLLEPKGKRKNGKSESSCSGL